mmetsp:Transcript_6177/g.18681  ORF Transcript_6177/g.18681 Transcript_6177/m.18681 type:complete len:734 (+) Transcript_6177:2-2203(+)
MDLLEYRVKLTIVLGLVVAFSPSLVIKAPLFFLWTVLSALLAILQGCYVTYQLAMIIVSLVVLSLLLAIRRAYAVLVYATRTTPRWQRLQAALSKADTWDEYVALAKAHAVDTSWVESEEDMPNATLLRRAMDDMRSARAANDAMRSLRFALSGLTKRSHLGIEASRWYPPSSPVATKKIIGEYQEAVTRSLHEVADAETVPTEDKVQFFNRVRRTVGVTALCLSGGGAITMYHTGILLGLIEAGLYDQIHVVSGTSGGSIMAAMVGCKTKEEMLQYVLCKGVSTDFKQDGEQQRKGYRFFPPLWKQMINFAKMRVLVGTKSFKECCDFYWGDMTFQEAHERTGKVLCISVSAQRADGQSDSMQRLLMNHITTPHVTLASAVAASCALPGILKPQRLEAKDANGVVKPFEVDGVDWIDGSIQADVPFKRMATLFNVSNFIVAQVNIHVRLVVEDSSSALMAGTGEGSTFWSTNFLNAYRRLVGAAELSVRMRATMLSQLGLMPSLYGNNLRKVFSQKYHGDVTISPRFTYMQTIGLSAICNPTVADMEQYIQGGKRALWPHITRIRHMLALETTLAECWNKVKSHRRRSKAQLSLETLSASSSQSNLQDVQELNIGLSDIEDDEDDVGEENRNHLTRVNSNGSSVSTSLASSKLKRVNAVRNKRRTPPLKKSSTTSASPDAGVSIETHYRQLEWEYRRLITRFERLRSENVDLRKRLEDIRSMCAPSKGNEAS